MNATEKFAWYTLGVIVLTALIVAVLLPFAGRGAWGGSGLLGLLGLSPLLFRRRAGEVIQDERDASIWQRSLVVAYSVFWLVFVAACMSTAAVYGWDGSVPVTFVVWGVMGGMVVVQAVMSLTILAQYRWGGPGAA